MEWKVFCVASFCPVWIAITGGDGCPSTSKMCSTTSISCKRELVKMVDSYKYPRTIINNQLDRTPNVDAVCEPKLRLLRGVEVREPTT